MANNNSAKKRIRQNATRRLRNRAVRSNVRTKIRAFESAVSTGDQVDGEAKLKVVIKALDTAAGKGVFHKNTVARTKSRLSSRLAALGA